MPRYKTSLRRETPQLQAPKDTTMPTFETEGGAPTGVSSGGGGGSGPPKWLVIGGIVAVGLGLVVFLRKGQGTGKNAATPTQTQESLAVGDLAYQVQNGLGALGVQRAQDLATLQQQIAATGSSITSIEQQDTNATQLQNQTFYESLRNLLYQLTPWRYPKGYLSSDAPANNNGYSILGYSPPFVGAESPGHHGYLGPPTPVTAG